MAGAVVTPMLGAIDNFWIVLAIVLGSAIWEWLKKKGLTNEPGPRPGKPEPPRRTTPIPPVATPGDWEAELRRLLGGEESPTAAPPPIQPVIVPEIKSVPSGRPAVAAEASPRPVPPTLAEAGISTAEKSVEMKLPALGGFTTAYDRAGHLHEKVVERLKRVEALTEHHSPATSVELRPPNSPELARTVALFRHPRSARQAVIASLVFGPPKGMGIE